MILIGRNENMKRNKLKQIPTPNNMSYNKWEREREGERERGGESEKERGREKERERKREGERE